MITLGIWKIHTKNRLAQMMSKPVCLLQVTAQPD